MRFAKQVRDNIWLNEYQVNVLECLIKYYGYSENDAIDKVIRFRNVLGRVPDLDYIYAANKIHLDESPDAWEKHLDSMDGFFGMVANEMQFPESKNKDAEICMQCGLYKYVNEPCLHC